MIVPYADAVTPEETLRRVILRARMKNEEPHSLEIVFQDCGPFRLVAEVVVEMNALSLYSYALTPKRAEQLELDRDEVLGEALRNSQYLFAPAILPKGRDLPVVRSFDDQLLGDKENFTLFSACYHNWRAVPFLIDWQFERRICDGAFFVPVESGYLVYQNPDHIPKGLKGFRLHLYSGELREEEA